MLLIGCIIAISGCATTHDYYSIVPTQNINSGLWTGQYNSLVATIKLNNDGNGIICQDHLGTARVMSIKISGDRVYSQDGTYWKLVQISPQVLKLNYAIGGGYTLQKDDAGNLITPACKEKI